MKEVKHYVLFVPVIVLVVIYVGHAAGALLESEEYYRLVGTLGFNEQITNLLVLSVLPLDGLVALFLIFGNKISKNFNWDYLLLWAGLWPWVPRGLELLGGFEIEWGDAVAASVLAALVYYLKHRENIHLMKRSE